MSSRRYFYLLTAFLVLLFGLIIAGAVGGNMILQKQSAKLTDLKIEDEVIEQQQTALLQAQKDIERYSELEKIVKTVVPQDKDQAKTVREIVAIANENDTPIKSVTFPSSTLGETAPAAPAANADGTPKQASQPPMSQVKPVQGIAGVYTLEIQVTSGERVTYQNFLRFLEDLEKNRRTAHVSGINLEPSENGTRLNFNLTLNAYLKP